jgi:hypothetical protein
VIRGQYRTTLWYNVKLYCVTNDILTNNFNYQKDEYSIGTRCMIWIMGKGLHFWGRAIVVIVIEGLEYCQFNPYLHNRKYKDKVRRCTKPLRGSFPIDPSEATQQGRSGTGNIGIFGLCPGASIGRGFFQGVSRRGSALYG